MVIECIKFKSFQKGTLQGFADFSIPNWGIEVFGFTLHMKEGKRWIGFPSKPYKNAEGEEKFMPYLRFKEKAHWERFVEEAKGAIDKFCADNSIEPVCQRSVEKPNENDAPGLPF